MTTKACGHRKHSPVTSQRQRGLFGSELARRRAGKKGRMPGITTEELVSHLEESAGKKLPKRVRRGKRILTNCWSALTATPA